MPYQEQEVQQDQIKEVFSFYRGLILDLLEQEMGQSPNWPFIRSRLLKILSQDRGLEAKVMQLLKWG
jgi:hypothetical protein